MSRASLLLALCVAALSRGADAHRPNPPKNQTELKLHMLKYFPTFQDYPDAVCNDGTSGAEMTVSSLSGRSGTGASVPECCRFAQPRASRPTSSRPRRLLDGGGDGPRQVQHLGRLSRGRRGSWVALCFLHAFLPVQQPPVTLDTHPIARPAPPSLPAQWCYNKATCLERLNSTVELTSSLVNNTVPRWPTRLALAGIFDYNDRRNPFAGANLVHIGYCSSDGWVGNSAPDENPLNGTVNAAGTLGWWFKGQVIIEAVMQVLVDSFGLGAQPGHRVLFGGCSSGARGAMYTLDYLGGMLPPSVQVRGLLDSPMWVYMDPMLPSVVPLDEQVREARALGKGGLLTV